MKIKMINKIFFSCSILIAVVLLGGCVSPGGPIVWPEDLERESHIDRLKPSSVSARAIVGVNPQLNYQVQAFHGVNQAGIVGWLVASAMVMGSNESAEDKQRLIVPIQNAALKFNLGAKMRQALEAQLKTVSWLNVGYVDRRPGRVLPLAATLFEETSDDALLLIEVGYKFSEDDKVLLVRGDVFVYPKNEPLKQKLGERQFDDQLLALYKNTFYYKHSLEPSDLESSLAIQRWGENDGELLVAAFTEAVSTLVGDIVADLS